ncbi:MAG: 2-hydroxyacid dehydrogenase [Variovorax sp.]|nr:2-hydroxyacid dehydrogenase [Variovorax sp.]
MNRRRFAALAANRVARAALEIFEHEPRVPAELIGDARLILTPHIGSATQETRRGMAENVIETLANHFGVSRRVPAAAV